MSYLEQILRVTLHKTSCITIYLPSQKPSKDELDMQDTAEEARTNSKVTVFYGPLHMDVPVLAEQEELIYISSVQTQDVIWKTCHGERERERERVRKTCADSVTR